MAKRIVEKTRNNGTMTESAFWGWIRSILRKNSIYWKPIQEIKKRNRRVNKGEGSNKFEYQCFSCKEWFPEYERGIKDGVKYSKRLIEYDHIHEAGSLKSKEDVGDFIERLFCEIDGLQVLCKECHKNKTFNK